MIIGPCTVVTGGARPAIMHNAGVRVAGAHVAQVGPLANLASAHPDEMFWPARDRVLMPGFVNTHAHLARHLGRGLGIWTSEEWARFERTLSADDMRWAAAAALIEGLRHGVTTVCDFHRASSWRERTLEAVFSAARSVGVRVTSCYGAAEEDTAADRRAAVDACREAAEDLRARRDGRLCALVGVQPRTLGAVESMLQDALDAAGEHAAVHLDLALDTTPSERWAARTRWTGSFLPSLWAHAESAPKGLLAAAQERGDVLSAVGTGGSTALTSDFEVAWGSDSGINAPPLPDTGHAWSMGARADLYYRRLFVTGPRWAGRHFGRGLGEISPGAPADLVLVDYRPATELSSHTLREHLWTGLMRAPVSGAMVGGEILLDNGILVSADEREIAARARRCAKRIWRQMEVVV